MIPLLQEHVWWRCTRVSNDETHLSVTM